MQKKPPAILIVLFISIIFMITQPKPTTFMLLALLLIILSMVVPFLNRRKRVEKTLQEFFQLTKEKRGRDSSPRDLLVQIYSFDDNYDDLLNIKELGLLWGLKLPKEYKMILDLEPDYEFRLDFFGTITMEFKKLTTGFQDYYYKSKTEYGYRDSKSVKRRPRYIRSIDYYYYMLFNSNSSIAQYEFEELNELKDYIINETSQNKTVVIKLFSKVNRPY